MRLLKKNLQIAIDGPAGAGKSIGAFKLAQKLNILYVYTGAMYRAIAWLALEKGIAWTDEKKILALLKKTDIELVKPSKKGRVCDVLVNGQDITPHLFLLSINQGSSVVGLLPKVRRNLVRLQKLMAKKQPVVMEGRDITTVVLPQADLKIFMTADIDIRAQRRLKDHLKRGEEMTLKQVIRETKKRDFQDSHRKADPLKVAPDAWILDTTYLGIKDEVKMIIMKLKQLNLIT